MNWRTASPKRNWRQRKRGSRSAKTLNNHNGTRPVDFSYLLHYKHGNQPCSGINMQKAKVRGRA
jgi:hypothetical protein